MGFKLAHTLKNIDGESRLSKQIPEVLDLNDEELAGVVGAHWGGWGGWGGCGRCGGCGGWGGWGFRRFGFRRFGFHHFEEGDDE